MTRTKLSIGSLVPSTLLAVSAQAADGTATTVGSAEPPESEVLTMIYVGALTAKGITAEPKLNIGSREVYMPVLIDGSIDPIPEHTGATMNGLDKNAMASAPRDVADALKKILPKGVSMLTPSAAQDSDVAGTQATANRDKLRATADLDPHIADMVLGEIDGIRFEPFTTLDVAGSLTLSTLQNGQVQAADMTSTDLAMKQSSLVALVDTKNVFPAQNIVPLIADEKVADKVTAALDAVSAAFTAEDLVTMNARLGDHEDYETVAAGWLAAHHLK